MSVHRHKEKHLSTRCMIITISDTRAEMDDKSGKLMQQLLEKEGHEVIKKRIIPDNKKEIKSHVQEGCHMKDIDVILTNGGTGLAPRDVTIETIQPLFHKEITGFGELFRMLSYKEDIGSAAILSRAVAGVYNSTAIFATPGSTGAVKLAMEKLILPELSHIVREIKK